MAGELARAFEDHATVMEDATVIDALTPLLLALMVHGDV